MLCLIHGILVFDFVNGIEIVQILNDKSKDQVSIFRMFI